MLNNFMNESIPLRILVDGKECLKTALPGTSLFYGGLQPAKGKKIRIELFAGTKSQTTDQWK